MQDPFAPLPQPESELQSKPLRPRQLSKLLMKNKSELAQQFGSTELDEGEFEAITPRGHLGIYKYVEGIKVLVRDLGSAKTRIENAIFSAAFMTVSELNEFEGEENITAVDKAVTILAKAASEGDMDAITQLFDRTLGRPKQQIENKNLNLTIDDILTMENLEDGGTLDAGESKTTAE